MPGASAVNSLTSLSSDVQGRVRSTLRSIVSLCERWRGDGAGFRLSNHAETYSAVLQLLTDLDDSIMSDTEARAWEAVAALEGLAQEEDSDVVPLWLLRLRGADSSTRTRLDRHASRLFYLIEAWLAIGFAEGLSQGSIVSEILSYSRDGSASPLWKEARRSGSFAAPMINSGDTNTRQGVPTSPLLAMVLTAQGALSDGFQSAVQASFAAQGATLYGVMRGSTYPCEDCDEVCAHVYPVGTIVLPVHPHCVCIPFIVE